MLHALARNWWVLLLRGICALLFGLMAFAWPGITLTALIILFGVYALLDGLVAVALALSGKADGRAWWEMLTVGLLGIAAGVATFIWPALTAVVLLVMIAIWSILRGIFEIAASIKLCKVIEHEWLLGTAGVLSIAFGVVLLMRPMLGALAVMWIIGAYAILFGVIAIALSLRLRGMKRHLEASSGGTGPTVGVA
jgi:uncharacterized membrane protein HdeD (DUF308 family)